MPCRHKFLIVAVRNSAIGLEIERKVRSKLLLKYVMNFYYTLSFKAVTIQTKLYLQLQVPKPVKHPICKQGPNLQAEGLCLLLRG